MWSWHPKHITKLFNCENIKIIINIREDTQSFIKSHILQNFKYYPKNLKITDFDIINLIKSKISIFYDYEKNINNWINEVGKIIVTL